MRKGVASYTVPHSFGVRAQLQNGCNAIGPTQKAPQTFCDTSARAANAPCASPHRSRADALGAMQQQPPPGGKGGGGALAASAVAAGEQQLSDVVSEAPAGGSEEPPPFEDYEGVLFKEVVQPLTAVQSSLLRDTVAWQRGVLATPCVVSYDARRGMWWARQPHFCTLHAPLRTEGGPETSQANRISCRSCVQTA